MRKRDHDLLAPVRSQWLTAVIAHSQTIAGRAPFINPEDIERLMSDFVHTLPRPATPVERLVLRAVLLDVAWRCGRAFHARAHRTNGRPCAFVPAVVLDHFWNAPMADPCAGFTSWAHAFSREFARTHPPTPASRAARIIRDNFDRKWTVAMLAKLVYATPSQLRRDFIRVYGVPIHEYQRAIRMMAAARQMSDGKTDAIAMHVGYRSRKNFNGAFRKVTDLTPTAFRRLTPQRASEIVDSIGLYRT